MPSDKQALTPSWGGLTVSHDKQVFVGGVRVALAPKEEAVLHTLLTHWPRMVKKEDFSQLVWDDRAMSDESLARCVARARKALSNVPGVSIKSIYGQGYGIEHRDKQTSPVPVQQLAFSQRLMGIAQAPSRLADTVAHCEGLINQRTRLSLTQSEAMLREVLRQDSGYVAAKVRLALCLAAQANSGMGDGRPLIKEGIALLEPSLHQRTASAEITTTYAHLLDCGWHFAQAAQYHALALSQAPDDALTHYNHGWHFLSRGQFQKAIASFQVAHTLNPFSVAIAIMYARALLTMQQIDQTTAVVDAMCEHFPESAAAALYRLSLTAYTSPSPALLAHAKQVRVDRLAWPLCNSNLAYIYARCGDMAASWNTINTPDDEGPSLKLSYIATFFLLDKADDAFDRIEQARQARVSFLPLVLHLPENYPYVIAHPRGRALLASLRQ